MSSPYSPKQPLLFSFTFLILDVLYFILDNYSRFIDYLLMSTVEHNLLHQSTKLSAFISLSDFPIPISTIFIVIKKLIICHWIYFIQNKISLYCKIIQSSPLSLSCFNTSMFVSSFICGMC